MIDPRTLLAFMDSMTHLPLDQRYRAVYVYAESLLRDEADEASQDAERELKPRDFGQQWDKAGPNDLANKVSGRGAA